MAQKPDDFEVLVDAPGHLIARFQSVILQIRTGTMTLGMLDEIEQAARLTRAAAPRGKVGAIAVVEEGADVSDAQVRQRQRELLRGLLSDSRTYVAGVVVGGGVRAPLIRTITRMITRGIERLYSAKSPEDAAQWLAGQLGNVTAVELSRAVDYARELARRQRG